MTSPSLNFALLVTGPCYGTQSASDAYRFARALLAQGHSIISIFFYQEGVHNGNSFSLPASDETDLHRAWIALANEQQLSLELCVAAALRRGQVDEESARQANLSGANVKAPFRLGGLGSMAQAVLTADRVVQF
ncbi:sulfurtransferase complex subunit TusD [Zobellella maritima]|uniref:sulfurtransferase complex subunit TusD n=1 Tax=Zobellella maritima TaxID=2059725 RepID=UPI000E30AE5C|nr:sulfurtransferase complex subunit TusD [Zobellella maritima]